MKFRSILILSFLFICSELFTQQLMNDSLYFCREYKNGQEIGLSDLFSINPKGDSITVMLRTKGNINESHVKIYIEKVTESSLKYISTQKFDVEPTWDYIFFEGIKFYEEGVFKVSLLRNDDSVIASNFVTIVFNKTKK